MALAFSGGKDSMACLHLLRDQLDCGIFVDTGYLLPETIHMVNYAASLLPVMHVVKTDRHRQNEEWGIPADIVPVDWTREAELFSGRKALRIQSWVRCHIENVNLPVWGKAKSLGVTHLVYGARKDEEVNSNTQAEQVQDGMTVLCPLAEWTAPQVLAYLETKMEVPEHFYSVHDSSSLDCYDCPAFEATSQNRVAWMKTKYPEAYAAYAVRHHAIYEALEEAVKPTGQERQPRSTSKKESE
ncbi:hypothetical protein W02_24510 [Nitrospira sp. KM1]|nr:hypothetical protein W02_24510 [Nitrospira sp. KM1]